MENITSRSNDTYKMLMRLLTSKGIRKHAQALCPGSKIVSEVLRDFPQQVESLIATPSMELPAAWENGKVIRLARELFQDLDLLGTNAPIALLRTTAIEPLPVASNDWRTCFSGDALALPFQDPENIGMAVRSAVAFGIRDIILLSESASPWLQKSFRASSGMVMRVRFWQGSPLQEFVAQASTLLVALSAEGKALAQAYFPSPCIILPGIEGAGLPQELRAQSVAIAMAPGVESLNGAVATAIVLHELSQRRK